MVPKSSVGQVLMNEVKEFYLASASDEAKDEFFRMDDHQRWRVLIPLLRSNAKTDRDRPLSSHYRKIVDLLAAIDTEIVELLEQPDLDLDELFAEKDA
jgi:hypothetical protein